MYRQERRRRAEDLGGSWDGRWSTSHIVLAHPSLTSQYRLKNRGNVCYSEAPEVKSRTEEICGDRDPDNQFPKGWYIGTGKVGL